MEYLDNKKSGVLGLLVGIVIGVLFAPKSGHDTRADLRREGKKAWKENKPKIERAAKKAALASEKLVEETADVAESVEVELDKLSDKAHDLSEKIAKFSTEARKGSLVAEKDVKTELERLTDSINSIVSELE